MNALVDGVARADLADIKEWKATTEEKAVAAARETKFIQAHLLKHYKSTLRLSSLRGAAATIIASAPLITALIAPLSTLYDIPALAQHWFRNADGQGLPDPPGCLALSAIGLAFNAVGNATLILRFSIKKRRWWNAVLFSSTACWAIKSVVAVVNLSVYGPNTIRDISQRYSEGFWAAVFSCLLAGIIATMLLIYAIYAKVNDVRDDEEVRVQARHFLLSELSLFLWLALEALVISRLENWEYFSAVYFAIVTALTVGFGSDFAPTTKAARILMFPFSLATIAALATQVSGIIAFFSDRAKKRKQRWRSLYEHTEHEAYSKMHPTTELLGEMRLLDRISKQEDAISRAYDLSISVAVFALFWCLGALAFHFLEGWSYGTGLYFCYVFFFTIGYGDYYPTTAAGRVFFIIYALVAVPIVASFAVQAVSQVMTALNQRRLEKSKESFGLTPRLDRTTTIHVGGSETETDPINPFISHAELVVASHKRHALHPDSEQSRTEEAEDRLAAAIDASDLQQATLAAGSASECSDSDSHVRTPDLAASSLRETAAASDAGHVQSSNSTRLGDTLRDLPIESEPQLLGEQLSDHIEREMVDEMLMFAVRLEEQARKIMLASLDTNSKAHLLLLADQIVMTRNMSLFENNDPAAAQRAVRKIAFSSDSSEMEILEGIHLYREAFANLLVSGSRLKQLQGKDQLIFERRRGLPYINGKPVEFSSEE